MRLFEADERRRERHFCKIESAKKCLGILSVKNRECRGYRGERRDEKKSILIAICDWPDGMDRMSSNWDQIIGSLTVLCDVECLFVHDVTQIHRVNVYRSIFWLVNVYVMQYLSARIECVNYVMFIMTNSPSWALWHCNLFDQDAK